jgi:hypothetical protein
MDRAQPSPRAREALVDELRDAVGDEAVDRADLDLERAVGERPGRPKPEANRVRLMIAVTGAAGVAVAVAIALALQSWWLLIPLLALHAVVTTIVVRTVLRATKDVEKPAATTQAMLEEEGVRDPEGALNDLVAQTAEQEPEREAGRTEADDIKRQQESWTPDSATRRSRPL